MSDQNPIKTELVAPPVTTQASVQIQLGIADGVKVRFIRAKMSANRTLADIVKQIAKAQKAATEAHEKFLAGIEDYSDPLASAPLKEIDNLAIDILSRSHCAAFAAMPENVPTTKYVSNNPKNRTRIFGYSRVAKYSTAAETADSTVQIVRGNLQLEWKVRVPMTEQQSALLDLQSEQEALAASLTEKAQTIRHYIAVELPALQEHATAEAAARWFARAEGADAIYNDDFNTAVDSSIIASAERLGLSASDLPALPGYQDAK